MKKVLIILFLAAVSLLCSINFIPAGGEIVNPGIRDSLVYYHNNTVDHLWYGAQSWAVRFDFEQYYGSQTGLQFAAEGALIYIPGTQSNDDMQIRVVEDEVNQPGTNVLFSSVLNYNSMVFGNWNVIQFDAEISSTVLWLVVDYNTNSTEQFIAASNGDGLNSYILNNDFYYTMSSFSYQSEFLFSLYGHFVTDGTDLDMLEFDFSGEMTSAARIYPKIVVRNTSDQTTVSPYLVFTLNQPEGELFLQEETSGIVQDTLWLDNIPAASIMTFDFTDSLYYALLHQPSQYQAEAEISCLTDSLPHNNSLELEFDTFNNSFPLVVVENCLQLDDNLSNNTLTVQQDFIVPEHTEIINYYADASNLPFFCVDSFNRYNYYSLVGLPATMLNGSRKIPGYISGTYYDDFSILYNAAEFDSTFISNLEITGRYNNNDFAEVIVHADNEESVLFSSFLNDCSIYVMIVEDVIDNASLPTGFTIPVLRYIPAQFTDLGLSAASSFADSIDFDYQLDFSTVSGNVSNCRAVCLLQNDETKQIYGYDSISFDDFQLMDLQNNQIEHSGLNIDIYPNPFTFNNDVNISFDFGKQIDKAELIIYNIKGQKVKTLEDSDLNLTHSFVWNGKDRNEKTVSSGVYFMKLKIQSAGKDFVQHKKCLLIKK